MPTPADSGEEIKGSTPPHMVVGAGVGSSWLTDPPGPDLSDDGLPDPLARWGNHLRWVYLRGVPLTHQDWIATHQGRCPPSCRPLPPGAPIATGPTHRWYTPETDPNIRQAIQEAIARARGAPLDAPVERTVLLPLQADGWNGFSCVVPEAPLPVMPTQPIIGDIY